MQLQKLVQIGIEFRIQHLWTIIKKIVRHLSITNGIYAQGQPLDLWLQLSSQERLLQLSSELLRRSHRRSKV